MANPATDPVILVISRDADFAQPLAQQVRSELLLACSVAETLAVAQPLKASVTLVVTPDDLGEECPVTVLKVRQPPLNMQELLQEIASVRQKQAGEEVALGGGYRLQPRQKQLLHVASGKASALTDKEVQLLQSLLDSAGKTVAREELLRQVWAIEAALDTHTLETHIYRLRTKFRELGDEENLIVASDGGYKLMGL